MVFYKSIPELHRVIIKKGAGIYCVPDEVLMAISENRPFSGIDYYNKVLSFTANKDIVSRRLFFDDALSYRVRAMEKLLTGDAFERFQEAMNQGSHNTGFCALFYGESGTGKTELAFQLARKTRRDILTIDCSEVASKWIGDSEKNARKIFNIYRIFSKNPRVKPILLLNEADSLMSKRIHANSEGSSSKWNSKLRMRALVSRFLWINSMFQRMLQPQ